jgi:hypothetical protein
LKNNKSQKHFFIKELQMTTCAVEYYTNQYLNELESCCENAPDCSCENDDYERAENQQEQYEDYWEGYYDNE